MLHPKGLKADAITGVGLRGESARCPRALLTLPMPNPFRSEMVTVHARNRELEQRVARLEEENRRIVAGFAPSWSRAPFWVLAPSLGTLAVFFGALAFLTIFFAVWQGVVPSAAPETPTCRFPRANTSAPERTLSGGEVRLGVQSRERREP